MTVGNIGETFVPFLIAELEILDAKVVEIALAYLLHLVQKEQLIC